MDRREIADILYDFTETLQLDSRRQRDLKDFEDKLKELSDKKPKTAKDRHTIALLKAYIKLRKDLDRITMIADAKWQQHS